MLSVKYQPFCLGLSVLTQKLEQKCRHFQIQFYGYIDLVTLNKILLNFVRECPVDNMSALDQMQWQHWLVVQEH